MSLEIKNIELLREIQKLLSELANKGCTVTQCSGTHFTVDIPEPKVIMKK